MSETPNRDGAAASHAETGSSLAGACIRLRMWPAVSIVIAYAAVAYGFSLFGSTNIQSFIGLVLVPVVALVLLVIWWLAASRAPVLDRFVGFLLLAGALAAVVFSQPSNGAMLLAYAAPAMMVGLVAILAVTQGVRWQRRRLWALGFMVLCTGVFGAMRVDTIGGNLAPIVSWRWSPTEEARSSALAVAEAHGTAALPAQAGPGDWPAFRGLARDGQVVGAKFSTDWSVAPKELWRRKVGAGWSSFAAVGDYVFTQEQRGQAELVTCYNAETGEEVWTNRVDAQFKDTMGLGPRATPSFDGGRLYTQGCTGVLQCLDAATGNTVWRRDVTKDAERDVPGYGFSSSPLVLGELAIVYSSGGEGKSVIAYNRVSGDVVWRAGHGGGGYSSPYLAVLGGVPQVLMASDFGLQSFSPESGAGLWEYAWKIEMNPRCTLPLVADGNRVLLGATGTAGSCLLRVEKTDGAWKTNEEWKNKKFRPYFNDYALHKGYCYGFDGDRLACIDLKTGERRWEGKRYGGQLLLFPEMDVLLVLSEAGDVILVSASSDKFSEVTQFKAIGGKTWNHPVVAHGRLFVRNAEEAACFALPGSSEAPQG